MLYFKKYELVLELKRYLEEKDTRSAAIFNFGIKYGRILDNYYDSKDLTDIILEAELPKSYLTELRKAINLSYDLKKTLDQVEDFDELSQLIY